MTLSPFGLTCCLPLEICYSFRSSVAIRPQRRVLFIFEQLNSILVYTFEKFSLHFSNIKQRY